MQKAIQVDLKIRKSPAMKQWCQTEETCLHFPLGHDGTIGCQPIHIEGLWESGEQIQNIRKTTLCSPEMIWGLICNGFTRVQPCHRHRNNIPDRCSYRPNLHAHLFRDLKMSKLSLGTLNVFPTLSARTCNDCHHLTKKIETIWSELGKIK